MAWLISSYSYIESKIRPQIRSRIGLHLLLNKMTHASFLNPSNLLVVPSLSVIRSSWPRATRSQANFLISVAAIIFVVSSLPFHPMPLGASRNRPTAESNPEWIESKSKFFRSLIWSTLNWVGTRWDLCRQNFSSFRRERRHKILWYSWL